MTYETQNSEYYLEEGKGVFAVGYPDENIPERQVATWREYMDWFETQVHEDTYDFCMHGLGHIQETKTFTNSEAKELNFHLSEAYLEAFLVDITEI